MLSLTLLLLYGDNNLALYTENNLVSHMLFTLLLILLCTAATVFAYFMSTLSDTALVQQSSIQC